VVRKKEKKNIYCGGWTGPGGVGRHDNPIIKNKKNKKIRKTAPRAAHL
jgi:hypothetical protein